MIALFKFVEQGWQERAREAQRDIWLLTGLIDHRLDLALLNAVIAKYRRIDAVPKGYHYPEFFR